MAHYAGSTGYDFFADNLVESGDTWALLADMIRLYKIKYGCLNHHDAVRMIRTDVLALGGEQNPYVTEPFAKVDSTI